MSACELAQAVKGLFGYSDDEVSACSGVMGVPITFLDKYNPEQFEIVGDFCNGSDGPWDLAKPLLESGKFVYKRIAIRKIFNDNK